MERSAVVAPSVSSHEDCHYAEPQPVNVLNLSISAALRSFLASFSSKFLM